MPDIDEYYIKCGEIEGTFHLTKSNLDHSFSSENYYHPTVKLKNPKLII